MIVATVSYHGLNGREFGLSIICQTDQIILSTGSKSTLVKTQESSPTFNGYLETLIRHSIDLLLHVGLMWYINSRSKYRL